MYRVFESFLWYNRTYYTKDYKPIKRTKKLLLSFHALFIGREMRWGRRPRETFPIDTGMLYRDSNEPCCLVAGTLSRRRILFPVANTFLYPSTSLALWSRIPSKNRINKKKKGGKEKRGRGENSFIEFQTDAIRLEERKDREWKWVRRM